MHQTLSPTPSAAAEEKWLDLLRLLLGWACASLSVVGALHVVIHVQILVPDMVQQMGWRCGTGEGDVRRSFQMVPVVVAIGVAAAMVSHGMGHGRCVARTAAILSVAWLVISLVISAHYKASAF